MATSSSAAGVALKPEQVAKHSTKNDCWVIIHGKLGRIAVVYASNECLQAKHMMLRVRLIYAIHKRAELTSEIQNSCLKHVTYSLPTRSHIHLT